MATPASFSSSSSSTHSKLHQGAQGRGGRESAEEERLDLEARVLKARETGRVEPSLVETWTRLGLLAQEAGDDRQAIAAFRQAVGIGYVDAPVQQRTWIALASSLINEGCRTEAYDALLSAISSQEVPIPPGKEEGSSWHYEVVEAYLSRIRLTAGPEGRGIDPSLQEGLSLAFTLSSQWDRAVECLETALSVRPEDPVLWNRLGVALGQAKAYPEAKEAYARALDLNPRYQRARDNLNALSGT
ncbi:MAG: hypothetical protein DHS80DRAFT_17795 [Piptocephalis tieghemiana]|nr:MAG: hypothetical protein DHS80DRAFT_17795 [Piptocephalis tieghemiana]